MAASKVSLFLDVLVHLNPNYHPLSENRNFSGLEAWPPDEVREHLLPNNEIEIFIDVCRFSTNLLNFHKILRGPV